MDKVSLPAPYGKECFFYRTVSTFPPTTAALSEGDRNEFFGIRTSTGLRQPWFSGMSSDIRDRKQYIIAEYVTASGALMFPAST